jgi:hypothetical protein
MRTMAQLLREGRPAADIMAMLSEKGREPLTPGRSERALRR